MSEVSKYLEIYTKEYLLELALSEVPDDVDKRQGSIIYDALAIGCTKLADAFMEVKQIVDQSYMRTATRDINVEYRAEERGIRREKATFAQRLATFTYSDGKPATIPIGSLFCTIEDNKENVVNFKVIGQYVVDDIAVFGSYVVECETEGTIGNTYFGEILPLTDIGTLGTATLTTVLTPARDIESIESVKERYFATFDIEAFGGNIADYKRIMSKFTGVGQKQIYPRTKEDEEIVVSCVDPNNQPISTDYGDTIQQTLDPENYYNNGNDTSGMGLGEVPIGHKVTVTTPEIFPINVELNVILQNTAYFETVRQNIETNLRAYIKQVQDLWDDGDGEYETIVYYNQVVVASSTAGGVVNVNDCKINGGEANIVLPQNRTKQLIPVLGTVTVSEA